MTSTVAGSRAVPPELPAYQLIAVPEATKEATVAPGQNDCAAVPVGAEGVVGWVLITTLADAADVHPVASVTVKV